MLRVLLAFTILVFGAHSQAFTFKISTFYTDGAIEVVALKKAAQQITEETEGRVKLKVYTGGVQGDDRTVLRKIRTGQLHGAFTQAGAFAQFYKDSQVYNMPLAFNNIEEAYYVREAMDAELQAGLEEAGWLSFGMIDGGFAYVMTNAPVASLTELRQQKMWIPANDPASEKGARAFELSPIVLSIGDVLTSLQTGAINAIAAPPKAALGLRWYSEVTHLTEVPLLYTYGMLSIHQKYFRKLSAEDAQLVRGILMETFAEVDQQNRIENRQAFEALQSAGIEVVTPSEEDFNEWRRYATGAVDQLIADGEVSQAIVDRFNSVLSEYRASH